ncbi:MAG TPA: glycosyltransferase family 4 protein [Thermoanaerobaculia bacterium]
MNRPLEAYGVAVAFILLYSLLSGSRPSTGALTLFVAVALAASIAVAWLRQWALRRRLLDVPTHRSSHETPTPRTAGAAVALLVLFVILAVPWFAGTGPDQSRTAAALGLLGLCIAALGFADDVRSLSVRIRLAVQLGCAVAFALGVERLQSLTLSETLQMDLGWLAIPLTVAWLVGLTNAYNFMDGIDGIAGLQAVIAGLGWAVIGGLRGDALLTLAGIGIAASATGFLVHNWPPARIFLGDAGSGFLGFVFAALTVIGARADATTLFVGALLVWPFLFDSILTFFRRLLAGEPVFAPHRAHLYQRMVAAGRSHRRVTNLFGTAALLTTLAALAVELRWAGALFWALGTAGVSAAVLYGIAFRDERERRRSRLEPPDCATD